MNATQPTPLTASERHSIAAMSNADIYADDRVSIVAQDWAVLGYSTPISGDQLARTRRKRADLITTGEPA